MVVGCVAGGCVAGGWVAGGWVVAGGSVVSEGAGVGVGVGVVDSADGFGTLATIVDGPPLGFGDGEGDGDRVAAAESAVLLLPRVPNSTSRPATIATTASTATRDERT
jgi:hypothetical protein